MTRDRDPNERLAPTHDSFGSMAPLDPSMAVRGLGPAGPHPHTPPDPWSGGPAAGGMGASVGGSYGASGGAPTSSVGVLGAVGSMGDMMQPPAVAVPSDLHDVYGPSGGSRAGRVIEVRPVAAAVSKPQTSLSALVVPPVLLIAGGASAAYLGMIVGSWPLGGLAGALGVVGALFSWVMLRG